MVAPLRYTTPGGSRGEFRSPHARIGLEPSLRDRFVGDLRHVCGDIRLLWLPRGTDTTTTVDASPYVRTFTYDATIAAQLSALGSGQAVSFNPANNDYATVPDASDLSFGNSTVDSPFSVFAVANVTDSADWRYILSKSATLGQEEWYFQIHSTDKLLLGFTDESAAAFIERRSNAAISMGSWRSFAGTYDGGGGATAANGVALYQDGAAIASTATNDAGYVAMQAGASVITLGSYDLTPSSEFNGNLAMVLLVARELTSAEVARVHTLCATYFAL